MTEEKSKQGKKNRRVGKEFEKLVQKDFESKGWIVARWTKNVEFKKNGYKIHGPTQEGNLIKAAETEYTYEGKLVDSKPKFNPFTHSLMMNSSGFPDFIAFSIINTDKKPIKINLKGDETGKIYNQFVFDVIGVECKSGKYLDIEEKEKCRWMLSNNIFSKIFIAFKSKERGKIEYIDFEEYDKKD